MAKELERITDHGRTLAPVRTVGNQYADMFDDLHRSKYWLDPIGMSQLQIAVRKRANSAVIHGRLYNLTYGHMFHTIAGGDREAVKVKRADGVMAPFAYVNIDRVLRFEFESTED